jgi:transposase InsO family protein
LRTSRPRQTAFVAARRSEILAHSSAEQWHYVCSEDNPADACTRGVVPKDFGPDCKWITGPTFLLDPAFVPVAFHPPSVFADDETAQVVNVGQLSVAQPSRHPSFLVVSKMITQSTQLNTLKRDVAQALRTEPVSDKEPTADELANAFRLCLAISQEEAFPRESDALAKGALIPRNSILKRVGPYIDPADGLLKVDGRLQHAELPARTRHPIIIAADHHLSKLIIEDCHFKVHHSGVEHTLSVVRQNFYLLQGRRAIRRILGKCIKCRTLHALPQAPRMASLPKERLQAFARAFTNVGLDCFGPFQVVICRRTVKRYGLLITCLSTRAVHLEVLDTMDADSFIMALRRFISLRGHPKVIFSDNGTNIVAGERELREGIDNLNSVRVTTEMIDRGIDWRFSPPSAPSFGGIWERLISSSKKAMKAILENRSVTDEVLRTVFAEVASLLNSRPLTNVPTDPAEPEPLTPFHFILGSANPHQAPDSESAFDGLSRRKWKQSQFITDQFWRRWMREYLPSLIERKKWDKSVRPLRIGDHVLIMNENTRRGEWLAGQITKVFPSSDNVIRKAAVKTARSELIRPVLKLCYISGPRTQD